MFSLRVDYPPADGQKRNIVVQKLAGESDDEEVKKPTQLGAAHNKPKLEKKPSQNSISSKGSRKGPKLPKKVPRKDSSEAAESKKHLLPPPKNQQRQTAEIRNEEYHTGKRMPQTNEPTVYLCKLARNVEDLDSTLRIIEESQALDQACKKLKTEMITRDVVKKLGQMNINVDNQTPAAKNPTEEAPTSSKLFKDLPVPPPASQFESPGRNVFLLRRAEREDLLEQIRMSEKRDFLAASRQAYLEKDRQAKENSRKVVYFDQSANHQKLMDLEDISDPAFAQSLVRIEVRPASSVEESLLPRIRTDLQCSELPEHLVSDVLVPEGPKSERTHSRDSNSENASGNDYGNTPSSRSKESSDEDDSQDFEDPRVKKLYRMMEKNRKGSDHSSDDGSNSNGDYDERKSTGQMSNELEEKPKKYRSKAKASKVSRSKNTHLTVAQDAWYHPDEGYD